MSFPRYPRYKDSGVEWLGEVPEHWEVTQLKRVVDPRRPITYGIVQAGPHVPDGIPYIRPADMSDEAGVLSLDDLLRTSLEIAEDYRRSTIREGDLVCSIGPSFGKVMVTPATLHGANLTQGTARVAVDSAECARFVFWVLRSAGSVAQWESSIGGATFRALNLGPLASTTLTVPPITEQHLVASFLDRETAKIDSLIAEQQHLIALLKEKRQAVVSHAVTRGLDPDAPIKPSGVEWLGDVPAHWSVCQLKHIVDPRKPITYGIVQAGPHTPDGIPYVRPADMTDEHGVSDLTSVLRTTPEIANAYARSRITTGDIICSIGPSFGKVMIVPPQLDGANLTQGTARVSILAPHVPRYFFWVLRGTSSVAQWESSVGGATFRALNLGPLAETLIPLPPPSEQHHISEVVNHKTSAIDALISEAERAIALLQERRTALISAAVTGKIDVRGLAQEQPEAEAA